MEAIRYEGFEMPPEGQLSERVIADFERWIRRGAVDPRDGHATGNEIPSIDIAQGREHWSYRPITKPELPADVVNSESPIDYLVRTRLAANNLSSVTKADRRTLVRRLYFDLLGLPPTPEEIESFCADRRDDAYVRLVDRLLASPRFGERWGRHWLDISRFAESITLRGFILPRGVAFS